MIKVIVITGYVLQIINNLKLSIKNKGLCTENTFQVNEHDKSLNLWIKYEQYLLKRHDNNDKLKASLKLSTDEEGLYI